MISLVPGLKGFSENIKAMGIVDRYLEHARLMIFCNGGDEEYFISSADFMTRNLDHRVEVTCPVFDKTIRSELKKLFEIQWSDNIKARRIDQSMSNDFVVKGKEPVHSQIEVYNYLKKISEKAADK